MSALTSQTFRKWMTTIGLFLTLFPMGMPWYWGNLSVYVKSYVIEERGQTSGIVGPWFLAGFDTGCSLGSFVSGCLMKSLGKRLTTVCGTLLCVSSFVFVYLTIGMHPIAIDLILGVLFSTGYFINNGVVLVYCAEWASSDFGQINSIAQAGLPAGAVVINQVITLYINPDNLTPGTDFGPLRYFSQHGLLDRVPVMFLILGVLLAAISIVGMAMVRDNSVKSSPPLGDLNVIDGVGEEDQIEPNRSEYKERIECEKTAYDGGRCTHYGAVQLQIKQQREEAFPRSESKDIELEKQRSSNTLGGYALKNFNDIEDEITNISKNENTTHNVNPGDTFPTDTTKQIYNNFDKPSCFATHDRGTDNISGHIVHENEEQKTYSNGNSSGEEVLSWRQIIKNPMFVHYCVLGSIGDATYIVLSAYYKSYGQVYIDDDHFTTDVSIAILIAMFLSRTVCGKSLDRFGLKTTFMAHFSSAGISTILFCFAPMINKWCFLAMTAIFAMTGSTIFIIIMYACHQTFGKPNLVTSFGLVFLPLTAVASVFSWLLGLLLETWGWFWLFFACTSWNLIGLVYSISRLPS